MEFVKLNAPTLKELFVRQIEDMILSGKLEIGTQLPSERSLAEQMQVSRTVVNTGIAEMAAKGFLEIRPRIGTFVADYRRYGTLDTLLSIMNYNGGVLRNTEIRSILEIRLVFDRLTISRVIDCASSDEIESLEQHLAKLRASKSPSATAQAAFGFHHELSVISGNSLLPLIYTSFKPPIISLWERYCRLYGSDTLYSNTQKLYNFIKARDADRAISWIEQYIGDAIKGNTEIYSE